MQAGQGEGERGRRRSTVATASPHGSGPILSLVISASKLGIRTYVSRTSPAGCER